MSANLALEETLKGTRLLHRLLLSLCVVIVFATLPPTLSGNAIRQLNALASLNFNDYRASVDTRIPEAIREMQITEQLMRDIQERAGEHITDERKKILVDGFALFVDSLIRRTPKTILDLPKSGATVGELYRYFRQNPHAKILLPRLDELSLYMSNAIVNYYAGPENKWQTFEIWRDHQAGQFLHDYHIYFSGHNARAVWEKAKTDYYEASGTSFLDWVAKQKDGNLLLVLGTSDSRELPGLTSRDWQKIENLTPEASIQALSAAGPQTSILGISIDTTILLIAAPLALLALEIYLFGYVRHLRSIWKSGEELVLNYPWAPLFKPPFGRWLLHVSTWGITSIAVVSLILQSRTVNASSLEWGVVSAAGALCIIVAWLTANAVEGLKREIKSQKVVEQPETPV